MEPLILVGVIVCALFIAVTTVLAWREGGRAQHEQPRSKPREGGTVLMSAVLPPASHASRTPHRDRLPAHLSPRRR